jgi:hypothetical protein
MRRLVMIAVAGLGFGAVTAGLGVATARTSTPEAPDSEQVTTGTTTPVAASTPAPWWFDADETGLGATVILPTGFEMDGSQLVFFYELADLAPPGRGRVLDLDEVNPFFAQPRRDPVVVPELWTLLTVDGPVPGASANALTRSARFDVPDSFVIGKITGLQIDRYRLRVPYVYDVELPTFEGAAVRLDDGLELSVRRVLPQSQTVIFQIDTTTPSDTFTAGEPAVVRLEGIGPEWVSSGQRETGDLQLIRSGSEIPPTIRLRVRAVYWVPFDGRLTVDLTGVEDG